MRKSGKCKCVSRVPKASVDLKKSEEDSKQERREKACGGERGSGDNKGRDRVKVLRTPGAGRCRCGRQGVIWAHTKDREGRDRGQRSIPKGLDPIAKLS